MAAVARPQVSSGSSGLKAALIAFVCIAVVSLGAFVYLFTQQSDLDNRVASATEQARQADQRAQQAADQLKYIAQQAAGVPTEEPAAIQQAFTGARTTLMQDPNVKGILPGDALVTVLKKLYDQYTALSNQAAALTAERNDLVAKLKAANDTAQAAQKDFQDQTTTLQEQYGKLEQEFASAREAWSRDVAELNRRLTAAGETASQSLTTERDAVKTLTQQVADRDARIEQLRETLAAFRPAADNTAPIQIADSSIVRVVPGQNLAYIGLGSRDRIKPGMNFAVYSRHRGIPASGQGKATLEVTHVFETTSECKVTSTVPGDPLMEGDIVANPVYDKNRQFSFVVAGDFDLNFDGKIEDPGGQEVKRMIQSWGGKIVNQLDTRTDFVVLGAAPAATPQGPAPDAAIAEEHQRELGTARRDFDSIIADAKSLGIPILTRTQFVHFIGQPVPGGSARAGS